MSHVTHINESCHTYEEATSHIQMSHVTHINESCPTYVQQLISLSRLGAFVDHTKNREDVRKELKGAYSHM